MSVSPVTTTEFKKSGITPLVQTDISELGDKRLNPEEAVAREREDLLKTASKYRISGQKELEDQERSAGPRMPYQELIRRLWQINPDIKVRDGVEGSVALYVRTHDGGQDSNYGPDPFSDFFIDHKYVTGCEKKPLPEYSHVILDTSLLPVREIRGWRSVLLAFIKSRAISVEDTLKEFGDPTTDQRSGLWLKQVQKYRKP